MSTRTILMTDAFYSYYLEASLREPTVLARLRDATLAHPEAGMQISPEQGQFMRFLVRLVGAERAIEIGTYTGYSALSVALALPEGGILVACERREEFTRIGQPFWREAGVADRIDLRIGKAIGTLQSMIDSGEDESVNGGAKLVHPGGAKLVHLTLCGMRCWGVVPVVHRRDPRSFV